MSSGELLAEDAAVEEAVNELQKAVNAKKCWSCGCLHSSLRDIDEAIPKSMQPPNLSRVIKEARERLVEVQYDCLGCPICYPPNALTALNVETVTCPTEEVEERQGWPPLAGDYSVLRYQAPVAICTLTDRKLSEAITTANVPGISIVGTLQTENLGIERLVRNVIANPYIRFLVICGPDSRQRIGHLPGQSLVALGRNGLNKKSRIIEARGKRPLLKNIEKMAIDHFRAAVEVLDLVGTSNIREILDVVAACVARAEGPAPPFAPKGVVIPTAGYVPERMIPDPTGYFVIYVDQRRKLLSLEHYRKDGVLNRVIEGKTASEIYTPAIEDRLVSRLDHAAYLGRELARAEQTLLDGTIYIQDGVSTQKCPTEACSDENTATKGRACCP